MSLREIFFIPTNFDFPSWKFLEKTPFAGKWTPSHRTHAKFAGKCASLPPLRELHNARDGLLRLLLGAPALAGEVVAEREEEVEVPVVPVPLLRRGGFFPRARAARRARSAPPAGAGRRVVEATGGALGAALPVAIHPRGGSTAALRRLCCGTLGMFFGSILPEKLICC